VVFDVHVSEPTADHVHLDAGLEQMNRQSSGGLIGNAVPVNGDYWTLSTNHALAGVFWRDEAGVVTEVVTRSGVASRLGVLDAGAGD
jgi:hypothetical protein